MGDASKVLKKGDKFRRSLNDKLNKDVEQAIEKPFRTGASAAARDASQMAVLQQQKDKVNIAETEDEIARKRAGAGGAAGRRSLIASSPTGLAKTLGGV
jgi:hypothetical protein